MDYCRAAVFYRIKIFLLLESELVVDTNTQRAVGAAVGVGAFHATVVDLLLIVLVDSPEAASVDAHVLIDVDGTSKPH